MSTSLRFAGLVVAGAILVPAAASAQTVYDWPSKEVPVAIQSGGSLFFVGKDKTIKRVYKWAANKGKNKQAAYFVDIDGDKNPDVVGAGRPSFGLNHDSNPIWFHAGGCDQLLAADFTLDDKIDFVCHKGRTLTAYSWDWQKAWSISIGKSWEWCVAGDINGDLKADIECKIRGSKKYSRVDGSTGEMLAADADGAEVANPKIPGVDPVGKGALEGQHDLDRDGTPEESLILDGNAVAIKSRSKKVAMGRIELGAPAVAAVVKDLDGDKRPEVIVVSSKKVGIWSVGDKEAKTYDLSSAKYRRHPVAELQSVYANGFEDDEAAKKGVEALQSKLDNCYAAQVKKNQFAGVGRVLLEVKASKAGKVTKVEKHHSEMADKTVVSCAQKVLKTAKLPKAGGDAASVNVTLFYTFRDK